jgi:glycopeptide antibiotics resistance protein
MMVDLETVLPVILPGLVVVLWYLRTRRRFTVGRLICAGGFAIYLLGVSHYTIFPLRLDSEYIEVFRSQTRFLDGVNWVPLRGWSLEYLVSVQCWGNVVLGIPWGLAFPFVVPVSGWRQLARSGAIFAAGIELTQCAISLIYGFAYRVIDINDFLLNFSGVMLGYAALRIAACSYRAVSGRHSRAANSQREGFWGHIESVLLGRPEQKAGCALARRL